ncbi:hypothetical protein [Sphingomonas sp. Leaf357]|nr:hypothetical protein [Sphingomonas sp. Leaf357]
MTFDLFPCILCIMGGFTLATVLRSILTKMEADDATDMREGEK